MNLLEVCSHQIVIARKSATVIEVAKLMREKHVGSVLVMNEGVPRRPIGIVTDRDIVIKAVAFADQKTVTSIEDVMSTHLVIAPGATEIYEALQLMRDRGVRRLLVVDSSGNVEGITTFDDLLPQMAQELGSMAQAIAAGLLREENNRVY